jgi:hypothetical protein
MVIGEKLKVLRAQKNMSRGDVEKRTGLLRCYISRIRPPFGISGTEQRILVTYAGLGRKETEMQDEAWIRTLADGRKVKFIYVGLPDDGALITAQLAGNEVVYSVILAKAGNPLGREDVESHFNGELAKK